MPLVAHYFLRTQADPPKNPKKVRPSISRVVHLGILSTGSWEPVYSLRAFARREMEKSVESIKSTECIVLRTHP